MILIQHLSHAIAEKTLFDDVSFKIGEDQKVGLVGPNGAGKTTLLRILQKLEDPDSGNVIINGETLGYLPQKLITTSNEEIGAYLRKFLAEEWEEYKMDEVLARVGLKGINKKTLIRKLSGGQKMKVGLAGVLLTEPTVLLLDEPTNNLDVESISWLEKFVQDFPGKVLLISHDRFFLDACVNKILELDPYTNKIVEYGGNYTQYKVQKEQRHQHLLSDYNLQQEKEAHMREWIAQKQEQLKFHPSNKVARQLQAMKTRLNREIVEDQLEKPQLYSSFAIQSVGDQLHQKKSVITFQDFAIFDLVQIPELYIFGQDRVHLKGANGSGKSTLLKSILGEMAVHTGALTIGEGIRLGYFSQEHEMLDENQLVIDAFMSQMTKSSEATARNVLGKFLFTKEKVFSQIKYLSEGEKARLSIAMIIYQHYDFVLLDEPTNHLDLESREILAEALRKYEGGFLVVSHDRYFLQQIGITRTLEIKDGLLQ